MLLDALDLLEREVSSTTGLPRWMTTTGDPSVTFDVDTMEDAAEATLEEWDEKNSGKKKRRGTTRWAVPVSVTGEPLEGGLARERLLLRADLDVFDEDDDPSAGLDIDRRMPKNGWDASQYG